MRELRHGVSGGTSGKADNKSKREAMPKGEFGPTERWQHTGRVLELTDHAGVLAARALEECVLDVLVARRWILPVHREAALRLKRDFHGAGLDPHLSGSYNALRSAFTPYGPWDERTDEQEAAYQRWRQAVKAIGQIYSGVVITTAYYDLMISTARAKTLAAGLKKLADWYKLPEE